MKKYFLLATTALLLGANVANAEVMEDGKVTMNVSAEIVDLGVRVDDSYGVNDVEFGSIIVDKEKQSGSTPLAYLDPETGKLEGIGSAFVAHDGNSQRGSFRVTSVDDRDFSAYAANADEGEGIIMNCWGDNDAYFIPEFYYEKGEDNSVVVNVGGELQGMLPDDSDRQYCEGSIDIMLETKLIAGEDYPI